jgi:hypothetical protein
VDDKGGRRELNEHVVEDSEGGHEDGGAEDAHAT